MNIRLITRRGQGFTLVEVMFSTVLFSIVLMAVGGMTVGYWRMQQDFLQEEITMQEISILSNLFTEQSRASTSANHDDQGIYFFNQSNAVWSSISYDESNRAIIWDPDTGSIGSEQQLLQHSVVENFYGNISITNGEVRMVVRIAEEELSKTNDYTFVAVQRNR